MKTKMKMLILLILAIVMCVFLCACGKSEAVKAAEDAIAAIGEVSLGSEAAVKNAEKLYGILTDDEKADVENRMVLADAKEQFDLLVAEEQDRLEQENKKAIYDNAKEVYDSLNEVAALCISGMDDVYGAWYFGIYEADECTSSNVLTKFANEVSFSSTELDKACESLGIMGAYLCYLDDSFQYCVACIHEAYELNGTYDTIQSLTENAKNKMQELTDVYDDYTFYPKLKEYYSKVVSYTEFFKNPTGSFKQLADTINDYENNLRTYREDIGFLF